MGDRVRMVGVMVDDPDPIAVGDEGTVVRVFHPSWSALPRAYDVEWDSGRSLSLLAHDPFVVVGQ